MIGVITTLSALFTFQTYKNKFSFLPSFLLEVVALIIVVVMCVFALSRAEFGLATFQLILAI